LDPDFLNGHIMFLWWGENRNNKEKELNNMIKTIINADIEELPPKIEEIKQFLPQYSDKILDSLTNRFIGLLQKPSVSESVVFAILSVFERVISDFQEGHGNNPFMRLLSHPRFLNSIFSHINAIDDSSLEILRMMNEHYPDIIREYLDRSPFSMINFIKSVKTENRYHYSYIILNIFEARACINETLFDILQPHLFSLPVIVALRLIIENPRIRSMVNEEKVSSWLLSHTYNSYIEIKEVVHYWPIIWNNGTVLNLIMLTKIHKIDTLDELNWIHNQEKIVQSVSSGIVGLLESKLSTSFENEDTHYCLFVLLYVLFHTRFNDPNQSFVSLLFRLIDSENEWVCAASLQVIVKWCLDNCLTISQPFLFKIAAKSIDNNVLYPIRSLFKALITASIKVNESAAALLSIEKALQFQQDDIDLIQSQPWCYPEFFDLCLPITEYASIDVFESTKVLGCIVDFLGMNQVDTRTH